MAHLQAVAPVSNEDINALPVKAIEPAIKFYEAVLGFSVVSRDAISAALSRDAVRIGLICQPDHEPAKAGSLAFRVDDLDAMHHELAVSNANPGAFGSDQWGGKEHRTFFVRENENGYCYCFYHPV